LLGGDAGGGHSFLGDDTGGGHGREGGREMVTSPELLGMEMSPGPAGGPGGSLLSQRQRARAAGMAGICRAAGPITCVSALPVESMRPTRAGSNGGPTTPETRHLPLTQLRSATDSAITGQPCPACGRVWCACSGEAPPPLQLADRLRHSRRSASAKLRASIGWRKLPVCFPPSPRSRSFLGHINLNLAPVSIP
jgi:hypothetical protein